MRFHSRQDNSTVCTAFCGWQQPLLLQDPWVASVCHTQLQVWAAVGWSAPGQNGCVEGVQGGIDAKTSPRRCRCSHEGPSLS